MKNAAQNNPGRLARKNRNENFLSCYRTPMTRNKIWTQQSFQKKKQGAIFQIVLAGVLNENLRSGAARRKHFRTAEGWDACGSRRRGCGGCTLLKTVRHRPFRRRDDRPASTTSSAGRTFVLHSSTATPWLSPTLPTPGDRIANTIQTRPVDSIFIPLDLSYFLLTNMISLDGVLANVL
jgi:hypothetical protein